MSSNTVVGALLTYPKNNNVAMMQYYGELSFNKKSFIGCPEGLKISDPTNKKKLLILSENDENLSHLLKYFPVCHYKLIGWITGDSITTYGGIDPNEVFTLADEYVSLPSIKICSYEAELIKKNKDIHKIEIIDNQLDYQITFKFGETNVDKKILVFKPRMDTGLIWHYRNMAGTAKVMGDFLCFADFQNYPNQFTDPNNLGTYNAWDYYFKPLSEIIETEVYQSANVTISDRYVKLSELNQNSLSSNLLRSFEYYQKKLLHFPEKTIGVFLRGTDYWIADWHPIPLDPYEAIQVVNRYLEYYKLDFVFLNTEDLRNYNVFKEYYGDKLIAIDRERFEPNKKMPHALGVVSSFNGLQTGLNYLIETYLTSRTFGVLSSMANSAGMIKNFGKCHNHFFEYCLNKDLRRPSKFNMLVVESHNKNYATLDNISNEVKNVFVKIDSSGNVFLKGVRESETPEIIIAYTPTVLLKYTQYNWWVSSDILKHFSVYLELFDRNLSIIGKFVPGPFTLEQNAVFFRILVSCKDIGVEVKFVVQLEDGKFPTKFEQSRYSETEIALQDSEGIYYEPNYLNSINFDLGLIDVGGNLLYISPKQLKLYHNIECYPRGFILLRIGDKKYALFEKIADFSLELEKCVDSHYDSIPSTLMNASILNDLVRSYLNSDKLYLNKKGLDWCNSHRSSATALDLITNYYYVHKQYDDFKRELLELSTLAPASSLNYIKMMWGDSNIPLVFLIEIIQILISKGVAGAYLWMGRAYRDGHGVSKNYSLAIEWMRKAADKNMDWMNEFCETLLKRGLQDDYEEVIQRCLTAWASKKSWAAWRIGLMYKHGFGVERNLVEAITWFKKALESGNSWARGDLIDALWRIGTNESVDDIKIICNNIPQEDYRSRILAKAILLSLNLKALDNVIEDCQPQKVIFISLGYNCEISQVLTHAFGQIDSYPWSWIHVRNESKLPKSLEDPDKILCGRTDYAFDRYGIRFVDFDFSFHAKGLINELSPNDANYVETFNRVNHLIDKYKQLSINNDSKIVFLLKISDSGIDLVDYCLSIKRILDARINNYSLVLVLSKELEYTNVEKINNVDIRYVDYYSKNSFTDIDSCYTQWFDILSEHSKLSLWYYTNSILYSIYNKVSFTNNSVSNGLLPRILKQVELLELKVSKNDSINLKNYLKINNYVDSRYKSIVDLIDTNTLKIDCFRG